MEFWRIYRLIYAKRYLILATMVIAAVVIFLGTSVQSQKRAYQAEAILQPQETPNLSTIVKQTMTGGTTGESEIAADSQTRVSNLIMVLRSSNDLYVKTADLLREDETMRVLDVQRILERNAYFASLDQEVANQANAQVASGALPASGRAQWIAVNIQRERKKVAERLAKGFDGSGPFAQVGLKDSEDTIADRIRQNMTFDTVQGPLSTDATPQIADQIKVTGKFEREAEAKLYVNLICVQFLDYYTNQRASAMNARIALLREKRDEVNDRLQKARQDKVEFLRSSKTALNSQTDMAFTQAAQREAQRDAAQADLSSASATVGALQSALHDVQTTRTTNLPANENPEVKALRAQINEANIAFQTIAAGNDGENSDRYKAAKARLDTANQELTAALARGYTTTTVSANIDDLQSKLTSAIALRDQSQQRLNVLNTQLAQNSAQLANLPAAQAKLKDLDREIAISEQNVSGLETTIAKDETDNINEGKAGTIGIVSEAHVLPVVSGIAAQRVKMMAYGVVLALLFGIALVIGMDALDNSVRTGDDLEKLTGLPVAGIIPEHLADPVRSPQVALLEPLSPAAEAYRILRTDLLFTAVEHPFQSLVAATGKPAQGATTTMCNLAIVLAQSGRTVALVDADLRQPKLNRIFGVGNAIGLTSVLDERATLDDALVATNVANLMLLPAGPFVNNPTDLLDSPRMHRLHEALKQRFDFVLFDTPSAIAFSDTAILSSFADATMMVVRASSVPRGTEDKVRTLLTRARANVIGAVLNGVAPNQVDSVHYHVGGGYPMLPPPPANLADTSSARTGSVGASLPSTPYQNSNIRTNERPRPAPAAIDEDEDDDLAIALPGNVREAPAAPDRPDDSKVAQSVAAADTASAAFAALPQPTSANPRRGKEDRWKPAPPSAYEASGTVYPALAAGKAPRPTVSLRWLLLIGVAGAVVGALVLLLGNGVGVR